LTAMRLIRPRGISAQGHATMPEFLGSTRNQNQSPKG
jgi:hypothetical protein